MLLQVHVNLAHMKSSSMSICLQVLGCRSLYISVLGLIHCIAKNFTGPHGLALRTLLPPICNFLYTLVAKDGWMDSHKMSVQRTTCCQ